MAEHARACGKAAAGESGPAGLAMLVAALLPLAVAPVQAQAAPPARPPVVFASKLPAPAAALPQPYGSTFKVDGLRVNPTLRPFAYDPARGSTSGDLREAGRVSWTVNGTTATFDQGSVERVVINWDSFNIGAGHSVHFKQDKDPAKYVSALNRIWSADPSLILGSLTADREVILLNANGVYFGRGARVDTGRFVATANAIADSVFERGLRNVTDGSAVMGIEGTDYKPTNLDAFISVEAGAEIRSAAGGDVLLVAPRVVNQGRIETPQGQAVLAAGDKVYLMSSSDPAQRGLIVAVDPIKLEDKPTENDPSLGSVENSAQGDPLDATTGLVNRINEIRAESGTVNLVGLLVRQAGHINATTAVKGANGVIHLQGMASTVNLASSSNATSQRGLLVEAGAQARVSDTGGTVEITTGSRTAVLPSASGATQIGAEVFNPSRVRVEGETITVADGATVVAPGGQVELLAASTRQLSRLFNSAAGFVPPDGSRVVIAPGAQLSVAGLRNVAVDGARNQATQRLFRIELADSPVQQSGPLYRQQVFFDGRNASGIDVADVASATAGIRYTAAEKATAGGTLRIASEGDVVVGQDAKLDVSGGSIHVSASTLQSSLLSRNGVIVQFRTAGSGTRYDALLDATLKTPVLAYDEGSAGGTLELVGRRLAVAGDVVGDVVLGEHQLDGSVAPATPSTLTIGRRDGTGQYLSGLALVPTTAAPIDPTIFDTPATADLSGLPSTTTLSLDAVGKGGFGTLLLRASRVEQPAFGTLDLGINGQLDIQAQQISLDGRYTLPGGTVNLLTNAADTTSTLTGLGDIRLSAATGLDTAGLWTNNTVAGGATGFSPFKLDGGKVTINAAHDLLAEPGLEIDVSGGARLAGGGALSRGRAGAITLAIGRSDYFDTRLQIEGVRLWGFDFSAGGSLSLGTPSVRVAGSEAAGSTGLSLDPEFFSTGGFGSVSINAFGDVLVASGAKLDPTLSSWLLSPEYRQAASGRMRAEVALPQPVDEALADRLPVNVTLAATRTANPDLGSVGGRLVVERGASITLEAGGTLALSATGQVEIGTQGGVEGEKASLTAPGGTLRLTLTGQRGTRSQSEAADDRNGFIASQATWIGADAELSVAGTAELRADRTAPAVLTFGTPASDADGPRTTGKVLGGGSIEIVNQRGYVVLEQGSQLNLDGAAAAMNLRGAAAPVTVASQPGRLVLSSPEGMVLDGAVSARVPLDGAGKPLTTGGSLQVSLGVGGVSTFTTGTAYPDAPRQLLLGDFGPTLAPGSLRPGDDLSAAIGNGITRLPLALLRAAGFDSLSLAAGDRISFETPTSLTAAIDITLDSPVLAAQPGVAVELAAHTVSLGDRTLYRLNPPASTVALPDSAADLSTRLWVQGQTIQAFGRSALQGFSTVHLDAGASALGEVRFGALSPLVEAQQGNSKDHLRFAGELTITSGQTFATTSADFTVEGLVAAGADDPGSRIVLRTSAAGAAPQAPLSAFGLLTLSATDIDHQGVLRQPFGAISLQAERTLWLGEGSLTSVSGAGQTQLYGETVNLSEWQQPISSVYSSVLPREKSISLSAALISTSPQARVDAAGGGTILASEFFAGVGGSTDYFNTPGLYAVLPDYGTRAPVSLAGDLAGVDTAGRELVVTMSGSGLAPGTYTLLPARYALLAGSLPQGAFLVRRASDQGSVLLGAPLVQDDGGIVVTGSIRSAGSAFLGAPGERFVVETAQVFGRRSEVRLTDTAELLTGRANVSDAPVPALPLDAGSIRISTTGDERSLWQAQLEAGAAGGKAGLLDITAARLALVDQLDKTPEAALGIAAASLAGSGAGSVLIGGLRSAGPVGDDGTPTSTIDAAGTHSVTVDLGATQALRLEELILVSSGTLSIAAGSSLESKDSGTLGARTLALTGDGALAFVSANELTSQRSGVANTAGHLLVGAGSLLQGAFVGLDATARLELDGSAGFAAGSLSLGAPRIAVGNLAQPDDSATVLAGELLTSVQATAQLSLRSYSSIDFIGEQLWAQRATPDGAATRVFDRLVLDAPVVRGLGDEQGLAQVDLAAHEIVLRNSAGGVAPSLGAGVGVLTLQALPQAQYGHTGGLTVGPGASLLAFDDTRLLSQGDIVLNGTGGLTAQGDLSLLGARLTATTGASHDIRADAGTLHVGTAASARSLGERVGQGAALSLSARRIVQDGHIELLAGLLDLTAAGDGDGSTALSFGAASTTSVAGFSVAGPDGFVVDGRAGRVQATAGSGAIQLLGRLDASAALRADGSRGEGDAGTIALQATGAGGTLVLADGGGTGVLAAHGGAREDDRGGSLHVDLRQVGDTAPLLAAVAAGGINHELDIRSREGDVELGTAVKEERLRIAADSGSLRLNGSVDARAAIGGVVQLSAGQDVVLGSTARIDARSTSAGAQGGDVLLSASSGRVTVAAGAGVDAGGDDSADGRIVLRALRSADGSTLQVDPLQSSDLRAGEVSLEAVRVYREVGSGGTRRDITAIVAGNSAVSGSAGNLGQATVNADSTAFMATAAGALDALGVAEADRERVHLRAGVEVQATGSLSVGADWALNAARPGGDAGFLTLRAAGDLNINGSLSDGFAGTATTAALLDSGRAWSYRLVAGADLSAANALATRAADTTGPGSLTVAAGRMVRTGAGSIELAAAQDVRFAAPTGTAGAAGIVYVAGTQRTGSDADAAMALFAGHQSTNKPSFTERGGRLEIEAGRDVIASEATQLVNNWLWRTGVMSTNEPDIGLFNTRSHLGWWTEFSRFRQSLGAFGGSSIHVRAGRDVVNLQAMAPNAGWADNRDPALATLRTIGGGEVDIQAGRDVLAGQFLAGRGTARVSAGGGVQGLAANVAVDELILAQMNGASWRVQARESVAVANSFNPTAMAVSSADNRVQTSSFFYTWGEDSALSLYAAAGNIEYTGADMGSLAARFGLSTTNINDYFRVMPSSLELIAFGGNADLLAGTGKGAVLFPGATAQLRIWADGLVRLGGASNNDPVLAMSDSAITEWPDYRSPATGTGGVLAVAGLIPRSLAGTASRGAIHGADTEPVRVHAEDSIVQLGSGTWRLPKAAQFSAGNDILNLRLETQHLHADDRTTVEAGRNFTAGLAGLVEVAGPGELDVRAGRQVDLGASNGLRTIGNQKNPNLPTEGASIRLAAATAATLDLAGFEAAYLADAGADANPRSARYRELLRDHVRDALADPSLDYAQAWAQFQRFPAQAQVALARQVLAAEFGAVYLEGPATSVASVTASLQSAFERRKADIIAAGEAALAANGSLELPGREALSGEALAGYLASVRALSFSGLDTERTVSRRVDSLEAVRQGWRDAVAATMGSTATALDALAAATPDDPTATSWRTALAARSGALFERYQEQVLERETTSAAAAASDFGRLSLPMRLALFDEGFRVAELTGAGSFVPQPVWPGATPVLRHSGQLEMTQSAVITERGGDISLVNAGGGINVGLKVSASGSSAPKGVIALGGGDVYGYARDDFQVNTQRVFIVGTGNMNIWSSSGDIDSGRGANTAVAAPPLAARRSVDGIVFEIPPTTTGSGLGILEDIRGQRNGTIGLFPAFGEILALDAFIRAPSVVLGSSIRGGNNLQAASVGGAAAVVAAPSTNVAPPPTNKDEQTGGTGTAPPTQETRPRNALLTVELLGLGAAPEDENCSEEDQKAGKCRKPSRR